jgi:hypothetical protein
MSDSDSFGEWIDSDSERSEDSDSSQGSLADFIDDDTPQRYVCSRAEICSSNIIQGKRKRVDVSEEEEEEEDSDSSSDYCPSE